MNERTVFLAALDITDPAERSIYLDRACAGNSKLRQQVDALLMANDRSGEFLDVPALRQMVDNPDVTQTSEMKNESKFDLAYLTPSTKPGSLGTLGHYEVMRVLGQGGFGTVLKAFDEKLHRMVAIKVLSRQLAATSPPRKRFLREARAVAAIKHENVVQVHSVEEQPLPYIVMEFVDGPTLQDKMDEAGPIDIPEVLHIGRQIAAGLAAAHSLGLIHRDIKPANILLEKGVVLKVKITDFGLARAADDASLTQSGTITGTPLYMAPEQAKGAKLDSRADLFSLGSVLYALACGHPPFRAATTLAVLRRVTEDTPRPLQEIIPETPDWFVAIVDKLLAKDPADRFQTAQEVADMLADSQSQVKQHVTVRDIAKIPVAKPGQRKIPSIKMVAYSGIAICLLAGIVAIIAGLFSRNPQTKLNDDSASAAVPTNQIVQSAESPSAAFKNSIGMEFVTVPKGISWMGGCEGVPGKRKVEMPNDFMMGKFEVTQGEWEAVMGTNPSSFSRNGALKHLVADFSDDEVKKLPVEMVSWNECQEFVEKLNKQTHESGWTYRLPTPDEWEYACRGGPLTNRSESAFSYYYTKPTNIYVSDQANYGFGKPVRRPVTVGKFEANKLGLHDMHGNVWEWCGERPSDKDLWKICFCGASWNDNAIFGAQHRDSNDNPNFPDFCGNGLGFRLVRVPAGKGAIMDPDRKAAEYVLSIGGEVRLHGVNREIQALTDLPPEPFELTAIMLRKNKQVTDAGLAACSECKKLTHLDLVETKITDTGVAHFAGNKNLVVLNLAHTSVSDEGLAHFQGNTNLTELWLGVMPKVTDRGMVYFKDCKKLTRLWLGGNYLTDKGVAHFKGCKNLLDLSVMNTSVTDQGLSHFQDCKNLKFLWLHGTKLTDTGLAYFNECHDLTEVYLDKTNFSNSWLTHLKNNKNLNTLSLTKTSASDGGLPLLKEFKNLKFLYLQETEITAAGIDGLKKSLPECWIEWNNGVIDPAATKDP